MDTRIFFERIHNKLNNKFHILWFTGMSGSGKTTLAIYAKKVCKDLGYRVKIIDGDDIRSRDEKKLVSQWIDIVASFITKLDVRTISDIGCGDFNVSSALLDRVNIGRYTGYDVSDYVIQENKIFESESIKFKKLDITREPQECSDLVIVREVFQHLSNKDIKLSLQNIIKSGSKNIIVGLHQPGKYLFKNLDMSTGEYTRLALYHAYLDLNNYSSSFFIMVFLSKPNSVSFSSKAFLRTRP